MITTSNDTVAYLRRYVVIVVRTTKGIYSSGARVTTHGSGTWVLRLVGSVSKVAYNSVTTVIVLRTAATEAFPET